MKIKNNNSVRITFIVLFAVFVIFSISIINYIFSLQKMFKTESKEYMGELASQSVVSLQTNIKKNLISIRELAQYLSVSEDMSEEEILHIMNETDFGAYFARAGFITPNGQGYTTKGEELDFNDSNIFTETLENGEFVSEPEYDEKLGINVTTYSAPVYRENTLVGIIFASYGVEIYEQALNFTWFGGTGSNFISTKDGTVLASSKIARASGVTFDSFMEINEGSDMKVAKAAQKMRADMAAGVSGFEEYVFNGEPCYVCYLPVGLNDWYLISAVPVDVVENKSATVMLYTVCICAAFVLFFLCILLLFVRLHTRSHEELEKLAFIDDITGKSNYNWFLREARKLLDDKEQHNHAIITFDIDKFKYVNDVYGYEFGNKLLSDIADSLKRNLNDGEISARIQSDCYVMLIEYHEQKDLLSRLSDLCEIVHRVGDQDGKHCDLIVAMGVYEVIDNSLDVQAMVDRAVIAKKTVKGSHRSNHAFYDDKIRSEIINEKKMESEMNTALAEGQFEVHYQPKYFIDSLQLSGAEALVRWNRPQRGLVPPGEFISLFEKNGFIVQIDLYVFTQVCIKMREWLDKGIKVVPISVNLSRKHIGNPIFVNNFLDVMKQYEIPPKYIEFELTESTIFEGGSSLLKLLDSIRDIGCAFSMDDFGTGYSSLNMLKDIPVDVLKLDREFLNNSVGNTRGREIITSIVGLAKKLGIRVVAEGVEEEEQLEFLKSVECDIAQGFYLSKPIKVEEFEKILFEQNV